MYFRLSQGPSLAVLAWSSVNSRVDAAQLEQLVQMSSIVDKATLIFPQKESYSALSGQCSSVPALSSRIECSLPQT
jgi:hypothetical protein